MVSQNNLPEESGVVKLVRGHTSDTVLKDVRVLPTVWSRQNIFGEKYTVASPMNKGNYGGGKRARTRNAGANKSQGNASLASMGSMDG